MSVIFDGPEEISAFQVFTLCRLAAFHAIAKRPLPLAARRWVERAMLVRLRAQS